MEGVKGEKGVLDPAPSGFSWEGLVALTRPEYYKVRADLPTKIELKVGVRVWAWVWISSVGLQDINTTYWPTLSRSPPSQLNPPSQPSHPSPSPPLLISLLVPLRFDTVPCPTPVSWGKSSPAKSSKSTLSSATGCRCGMGGWTRRGCSGAWDPTKMRPDNPQL